MSEALGIDVGSEAVKVGATADGVVGHGAAAGPQYERQTHRHGQGGNVVEEDNGIDAKAARQQRRLGRPFDVLGELVERQPGATLLNSGFQRPAWRMAQTGGLSTASPRAARISRWGEERGGSLMAASFRASRQHTAWQCRR